MITNGVQIISNWFTFAVIGHIGKCPIVRLNNPDFLFLFVCSHDIINFEQKSHYSVIITGTFKLSIINRIAAFLKNQMKSVQTPILCFTISLKHHAVSRVIHVVVFVPNRFYDPFNSEDSLLRNGIQ